jgi:predicted transcriptional regulator
MIAETSRRALAEVKVHKWYGRIRVLMLDHPNRDWCISEVAEALHEQKSTVSPRLNEMRANGWIEKTSERKSTITGVESVCYKLK